jgi:hypothetical protein
MEGVTQFPETKSQVGNILHLGLNRTNPLPQPGGEEFFFWHLVISIIIFALCKKKE